jgi:uncharacterized membrane protein
MGGAALASFLFPIIIPSLLSSKRLRRVVPPVTMPPVAVVVPPVAPLPLAVAVLVPRHRAARHLLCSLAANRRNWTLPRHSGIAHDE